MVLRPACGRLSKAKANNKVWVLNEKQDGDVTDGEDLREYEDVGKDMVDVDHEVAEKAELNRR